MRPETRRIIIQGCESVTDGRKAYMAMYDYSRHSNMYAVNPSNFIMGMEIFFFLLILVIAWFEARR